MKKIRNLDTVSAHFRNSAGPIKDKKKEDNKNFCDKKPLKKELFVFLDDCTRSIRFMQNNPHHFCKCGHELFDHQLPQILIDVFDRNTRCTKCLCKL